MDAKPAGKSRSAGDPGPVCGTTRRANRCFACWMDYGTNWSRIRPRFVMLSGDSGSTNNWKRRCSAMTASPVRWSSPILPPAVCDTLMRRLSLAPMLPICRARGRESVFFNQAVRTQLGLPDRRTALASERAGPLISLLSSVPEVWVTWQARRNGEPNPLSPWFERLETFHVLAYGTSLRGAEVVFSQILAAEKQDGFAAPAKFGSPRALPAARSCSRTKPFPQAATTA